MICKLLNVIYDVALKQNKVEEDKMSEAKMTNYEIYTTNSPDPIEFVGRFRRDLETENWHYYETEDGIICHFRKKHMVAVIGDIADSVKANRREPMRQFPVK